MVLPSWRGSVVALLALMLGACAEPVKYPRSDTDQTLFGAAAMRIHPIFTQVRDWTGDGNPDGIEVLIELQDQFGDPTKASGRVIFELFEYRTSSMDPRGLRLANPWIGKLLTLEDQQAHWNRTSQTYSFQLAYPQIRTDKNYVLTALYELSGGGRFFSRVIIQGHPTERPSTQPTTQSTTRPTTQSTTEPATQSSGAGPVAQPGQRTPEP